MITVTVTVVGFATFSISRSSQQTWARICGTGKTWRFTITKRKGEKRQPQEEGEVAIGGERVAGATVEAEVAGIAGAEVTAVVATPEAAAEVTAAGAIPGVGAATAAAGVGVAAGAEGAIGAVVIPRVAVAAAGVIVGVCLLIIKYHRQQKPLPPNQNSLSRANNNTLHVSSLPASRQTF
jgi:hypothetical protein